MGTTKRKQISKKIRFEVFKRDGFQCKYCGETPPKVILHIDHIHPVSDGGSNNIDNLVTACRSCNLGKSNIPLSEIPKSLKEKAEEIAEKEAQIKAYYAVVSAKAERIERELWEIVAAIEGDSGVELYEKRRLTSIRRFLEKLPFHVVLEAAELAFNRVARSDIGRFKYFCAVCWNAISRDEAGSQ